jgi:hypothetical protein
VLRVAVISICMSNIITKCLRYVLFLSRKYNYIPTQPLTNINLHSFICKTHSLMHKFSFWSLLPLQSVQSLHIALRTFLLDYFLCNLCCLFLRFYIRSFVNTFGESLESFLFSFPSFLPCFISNEMLKSREYFK